MSRLQPAVGVHDHLQGYRDAELALVMFGDYECVYSARAHLTVKAVQQQLRHRLLFVFRYFPLRTLHAHAEIAAETAEASAAQGKFWQMHDKLFENQHALEPEHLLSYACDLGLDSKRIASELAGGVHEPRVRDDFMSGVRSGVNGTPAFFVNGARYDGLWEEEPLIHALLEPETRPIQTSR